MRKYLILLTVSFLFVLNGCGQQSEQEEKPKEKAVAQKDETIEKTVTNKEDTVEQKETVEQKQKLAMTSEEENVQPTKEKIERTQQQTIKQMEPVQSPVEKNHTKEPSPPSKQEEVKTPSVEPKENQVVTEAPVKPETTPQANSRQETQATQEVEPKTEMVTISITGHENSSILHATSVAIKEGDSVLDVLKSITKQKQIQLDYSGIGAAVYIEGIGGVYEFDQGPLSGWMFSVNGVFSNKSAGSVKVQNGDSIDWVYTTDLGKDVGAFGQ